MVPFAWSMINFLSLRLFPFLLSHLSLLINQKYLSRLFKFLRSRRLKFKLMYQKDFQPVKLKHPQKTTQVDCLFEVIDLTKSARYFVRKPQLF